MIKNFKWETKYVGDDSIILSPHVSLFKFVSRLQLLRSWFTLTFNLQLSFFLYIRLFVFTIWIIKNSKTIAVSKTIFVMFENHLYSLYCSKHSSFCFYFLFWRVHIWIRELFFNLGEQLTTRLVPRSTVIVLKTMV